jgi:hypothetical protein
MLLQKLWHILCKFKAVMKKSLYILSFLLLTLSFSSCTIEEHYETYDNPQSLNQTLQSYDLWYVDIDRTTGTGDIPFMSRAFTISFMYNGTVFANNNIVGIGVTGNGYGINVGSYQSFDYDGIVEIAHAIDGVVAFEVRQLSNNEIELFNRAENVKYLLVGYQKNHFDYDKLFYENISYFLQEFEAWSKVYEDLSQPGAVFAGENHLAFYVDGNTNTFQTSEMAPNTPDASIQWDYTGNYDVYNSSVEDVKELVLRYYIDNSQEDFDLVILNDHRIRLINFNTNNLYEFEGQNYIQYMRPGRLKNLHKTISKTHYELVK